jgi:hypothetical protein
MFGARLSNISSPWTNIPKRIHSKLERLFRSEGIPSRKHVFLIIKTNHDEKSYVYVGLNVKCASFLDLPECNQNLNLLTIISKNPQIWTLKGKMYLMAVALIQAEGRRRKNMTKPGVAFRISFAKVTNNDSTYYSQRLSFIKKLKILS